MSRTMRTGGAAPGIAGAALIVTSPILFGCRSPEEFLGCSANAGLRRLARPATIARGCVRTGASTTGWRAILRA
jgi:hypothetical protein